MLKITLDGEVSRLAGQMEDLGCIRPYSIEPRMIFRLELSQNTAIIMVIEGSLSIRRDEWMEEWEEEFPQLEAGSILVITTDDRFDFFNETTETVQAIAINCRSVGSFTAP